MTQAQHRVKTKYAKAKNVKTKPLKVKNLTRSEIIVKQGRIADTFWTRLKGLIGVREFADGDGLWIKPSKGVHCMFMSIPIDAVYLDREHTVIALDHAMKPWSPGRVFAKCTSVLELPAGRIERAQIAVGDQLLIQS